MVRADTRLELDLEGGKEGKKELNSMAIGGRARTGTESTMLWKRMEWREVPAVGRGGRVMEWDGSKQWLVMRTDEEW